MFRNSAALATLVSFAALSSFTMIANARAEEAAGTPNAAAATASETPKHECDCHGKKGMCARKSKGKKRTPSSAVSSGRARANTDGACPCGGNCDCSDCAC